jgi:hypothetical membrane protein
MIVPMDRADLAVASLVRAWLRLYTVGVSPQKRERRAQQLESDLWEHQADATARGISRGVTSLSIVDRMVRGIPADIAWRTRIGGFAVTISIPFNRAVGLVLLALVIAVPIATTMAGWDTDRDAWGAQLRDLGERQRWQTHLTNIFQVIAGLGLIAAGIALGVTMAQRSRGLAIVAGVLLGIAGTLTLVSAALYAAVAELAQEFAAGTAEPGAAGTARGLAIVLQNTVAVATLCAVGGVFVISVAAARQALLPRWLRFGPPLAITSGVASVVLGGFEATENAEWLSFIVTFVLTLGWLVVAGGMLALRRLDTLPLPTPPAAPA